MEAVLDLDLFLVAIALALDEDGLGVMQQPVEQRCGEHGVLVDDAGRSGQETARLKMEKEILGRAAAYFAREVV